MKSPMALLPCALVAVLFGAGCGGSSTLSEVDIHAALAKLPYDYTFRSVDYAGDGAVVAGTARLRDHVTYFAVISGYPSHTGPVLPPQRLLGGGTQRGVDTTNGTRGKPWTTKFVYTRTSIPRISESIDTAICIAAGGGDQDCRGV